MKSYTFNAVSRHLCPLPVAVSGLGVHAKFFPSFQINFSWQKNLDGNDLFRNWKVAIFLTRIKMVIVLRSMDMFAAYAVLVSEYCITVEITILCHSFMRYLLKLPSTL
jgi:hypothetical protein